MSSGKEPRRGRERERESLSGMVHQSMKIVIRWFKLSKQAVFSPFWLRATADHHRPCHDSFAPGARNSRPQVSTRWPRGAWASETSVNQELLTSYFNKAGADRQANKTNTKWKVLQPAADHGPLPSHVLPQVSSREGLAAVPRSTHKEDTQNLLARAAGVLAVCISSGTILFNREIYGSESLSQRYVTMAEAHAAAPKATC